MHHATGELYDLANQAFTRGTLQLFPSRYKSIKKGKSTVENKTPTTHIPALTGVRFFAVMHIFMFHLWALYTMDKPQDSQSLLEGFGSLPEKFILFFSHGWMSTSFFFILSGFILSYLYWNEDGTLTGKKCHFWLKRFARIYPIHLIVLLITFLVLGSWYLQSRSLLELLPSALGTLFLVQAWYPPWVPEWSWPTWTISALVFLYAITPWLMYMLAKLTRNQMLLLLACLPIVSIIPTAIYAVYFPAGSEPVQNWQIFIGSTPLFWIAQFVGGMLLSRSFGISRFNSTWRKENPRFFAWGDLALLAVMGIALYPDIEEPFKFFLRHGLLMPLYLVIIFDLSHGRGIAARLFALPGTGFLGETAFSLFIWQTLIMIACWITAQHFSGAGQAQAWAAPLALVLLSIASTYGIEKPLAKKLRRALRLK